MEIDPVCGAELDEKDVVDKSHFAGRTYYFCDPECKKTFDESPEEFAGIEQTGT